MKRLKCQYCDCETIKYSEEEYELTGDVICSDCIFNAYDDKVEDFNEKDIS